MNLTTLSEQISCVLWHDDRLMVRAATPLRNAVLQLASGSHLTQLSPIAPDVIFRGRVTMPPQDHEFVQIMVDTLSNWTLAGGETLQFAIKDRNLKQTIMLGEMITLPPGLHRIRFSALFGGHRAIAALNVAVVSRDGTVLQREAEMLRPGYPGGPTAESFQPVELTLPVVDGAYGLTISLDYIDTDAPDDPYNPFIFIATPTIIGICEPDFPDTAVLFRGADLLEADWHEADLPQDTWSSGAIALTAGERRMPLRAPKLQEMQADPSAEAPHLDDGDRQALSLLFDTEFYCSGFATGAAPADPLGHYWEIGQHEGRDPTPWFSDRHYLALHQDVAQAKMNPFLHYCLAGKAESRSLVPLGKAPEGNTYQAHEYAVAPGPYFEEFDPTIGVGRRKRAKVLAYYLPQFHPIEVNDQQWGKGFTEWRNLPRAMPRFMGHVQPRIPRDLGCYTLDEGDVMRRQIEMARAAGIHGFCFYHYSFDGQRVLETPVNRLLADPTLDFPFCLMWANENWTRTWDGSEKEIILGQSYASSDDVIFIDELARHMVDPRYIRIGDRPLFFIYRPGHIPEAKATLQKWRQIFRDRHGLDPLIFNAQAFGDNSPLPFDLDGAIEFPPHKILPQARNIASELPLLDPAFRGDIRRYDEIVTAATDTDEAEFPLIRTSFPSWDNDARRPGRGTIICDSTPAKFGEWLNWTIEHANRHPIYGEPIVCINAWNEWAEGAYLEPDVHFGGAYLNTVARVVHRGINAVTRADRPGVLLVGHDILPFGAQKLLLHLAETLRGGFGCDVTFLIGSSNDHGGRLGSMADAYRRHGTVHFADQEALEPLLADLMRQGFRSAVTNTTLSGAMVGPLKEAGFQVVSLIHELPNLLKSYKLEGAAAEIARLSDHVVFPADIVRSGFEGITGGIQNIAETFPQGLYNTSVLEAPRGDNGLRAELGLKPNTRIILGVGYADLRKGIDRFVSTALSVCTRQDGIAFLWVGAPAEETLNWFQPEIEAAGFGDRIRILGQHSEIARFFTAADLFYLSSREDPFPSVVLEALACGLPVIGHAGCGGCDDLIRRHGTLVAQGDPQEVGDAILATLAIGKQKAQKTAALRRREIEQNYDFSSYVFGLLQRLQPDLVEVSAIVPNYRYEAYIGERLRSVFDQTYPLREVLVLDDASPDNSLAEITRTVEAAQRKVALHVNDRNSGSPFPQWRKGVELAQGEYVWIAEADDLADPTLIARLVAQMRQADSVLGFVDSRQIDENGDPLGDSYRPYINQIEPGAFDQAFDMEGPEFLARYLSVKNVILNVSGVILRRDALLEAFATVGDALFDYGVAGDWRLYAELCAKPGSRVSYLPDPLNTHRRHRISVTHALKVDKHLAEIAGMHAFVASHANLSAEQIRRQAENYEQCRQYMAGET